MTIHSVCIGALGVQARVCRSRISKNVWSAVVSTQDDLVERVGMHVGPGPLLAALWARGGARRGVDARTVEGQAGSVGTGRHCDARPADHRCRRSTRRRCEEHGQRELETPTRAWDPKRNVSVACSPHRCTTRRLCRWFAATGAGELQRHRRGHHAVSRANLLDAARRITDTPARELLDLIDKEGQRVVVRDAGGAPLGINQEPAPLLDPKSEHKRRDLTAGSLMRTVPTISQDASVEEALEWMVEHSRKRLPVIDRGGALRGHAEPGRTAAAVLAPHNPWRSLRSCPKTIVPRNQYRRFESPLR